MTTLAEPKCEWCDGVRLMAWLAEEYGFTGSGQCKSVPMYDTVRKWRKGQAASIWKVDELMTRLGLHIHLIPDSVYLPYDPKTLGEERKQNDR